MFIVAKTTKSNEYLYSKKYSILCKSENEARRLAEHLNNNKNSLNGEWKLKENELYHVYEIDKYDNQPMYKLKNTKNKITIAYNY